MVKSSFFLYNFYVFNHNPVSITNLSHLPPRTGITCLSYPDARSKIPNVAFLSRLSIAIVGQTALYNECRNRSIVAQNVVRFFVSFSFLFINLFSF